MDRKSGFSCVVIVAWVACLAAHAESVPSKTGKADFQRICIGCHSTDRATSQRMTRAEWAGVVSDMVGRGAQGSSAELDNVVSYLSANFGKNNPSTAPVRPAPPTPQVAAVQSPLSLEQIAKASGLIQANACLSCHRLGDTGSYLGPALTDVGAHRSPEQLRTSLVSPSKVVLPENRIVRLVTSDGSEVTGRLLNQDAFSVQLIDSSSQLKTFERPGLREFAIVTTNPMPSYADKLSGPQLADLIRYLSSLKGASTQ